MIFIVVNVKIINQVCFLFGGFDVFKCNVSVQFMSNSNVIFGVNGMVVIFNIIVNSVLDNILSLDLVGMLIINVYFFCGVIEIVIIEKICNVGVYGCFDVIQWNCICDYQLNIDFILWSVYVNVGNLVNQCGNNWCIWIFWVELGSSDIVNIQQKFDFNSDLFNDFYFGCIFGNNDNVNLFFYDQFNGIVSGIVGVYSFYGEIVQK